MKRERIINDDALLHLTYESLTGLTDEMMCVICMEVVKDTMATECLHRYCRDCIDKHLRVVGKKCPHCRKDISTKRKLRKDFRFDALGMLMSPERLQQPDGDVKQRQKEIEAGKELHRMRSTAMLQSQRRRMSRRQLPSSTSFNSISDSSSGTNRSRNNSSSSSSSSSNDTFVTTRGDVTFTLMRHPEEKHMVDVLNSAVRLSSSHGYGAKVGHIKSFLLHQLPEIMGTTSANAVELIATTPAEDKDSSCYLLDDESFLMEILHLFDEQTLHIVILYRLSTLS